MTERTMTYDEWCDEFQPIVNIFSRDPDETRFETYGKELDFILSRDPARVWTEVDAEGRFTTIVDGYHLVNRLAYYVTEVPRDFDTFYEIRDPELEKLR